MYIVLLNIKVEDKAFFKKVDEFKNLAKSLFEILHIITKQKINIV